MPVDRDFPEMVRAHVPSVWSLELLLLIRRDPDRRWSEQALCDELRATLPIVTSGLEAFERSGLVARDASGAYHYRAASPLLEAFAETLAAQYRERQVAVINLIVAPEHRIQQLADAFRFRGGHRS